MLPSYFKAVSLKQSFTIPTLIISMAVLSSGLTACQNFTVNTSSPHGHLQIDKLPSGQEISHGELIVVFHKNTSMTIVNNIAKEYGMNVKQELGIINGYVFTSDKDVNDLQQAMEMINNHPAVDYAEYNGIASINGGLDIN